MKRDRTKLFKYGWIDFYVKKSFAIPDPKFSNMSGDVPAIVKTDMVFLGRVENAVQALYLRVPHDLEHNAFYYCGKCKELNVWAKIMFEYNSGWIAHCHTCIDCGGSGSLIMSNQALQDLENMPKDLVKYEFTEVNRDGEGLWRAS